MFKWKNLPPYVKDLALALVIFAVVVSFAKWTGLDKSEPTQHYVKVEK